MSKAKQKGTRFETQVADYLREKLGQAVERRTLAGVNDKGDIAGIRLPDGRELVIECKNHKTYELSSWREEARREARNAGGLGVVVFHAHGVGATRMGDQFVLMGLDELIEMIGGRHGGI